MAHPARLSGLSRKALACARRRDALGLLKTFTTPTLQLTVLDEVTVLVEGRPEVEVTAAHAQRDNDLIASLMKGNYGMIVDRKADYSIVPLDVYRILNSMPRLKAVAIVSHRSLTTMSAVTERPLYKGHFMSFGDVESAHAWVRSVVSPPEAGAASD